MKSLEVRVVAMDEGEAVYSTQLKFGLDWEAYYPDEICCLLEDFGVHSLVPEDLLDLFFVHLLYDGNHPLYRLMGDRRGNRSFSANAAK